MVMSRETPLVSRPDLRTALRQGLESLTVTGPSRILERMYREAREAVARRPTPQERETALSQAWAASSRAVQALQSSSPSVAVQSSEEMYSKLREAISASRRS